MISIYRIGGIYLLVIAITAFASYTAAIAQVNFTTNEGQFIAANPSLLFQDFQAANVAPGDSTSCNVPVNQNSDDACFMPGDILPGIEFTDVPPNFEDIIVAGAGIFSNNNPPTPHTPARRAISASSSNRS